MQAHARVYCANEEARDTVVAREGRSGHEYQELGIHLGEPRNTTIKLPTEPLNCAPVCTASWWNDETVWTSMPAPKVCGDGLGMLGRALFRADW